MTTLRPIPLAAGIALIVATWIIQPRAFFQAYLTAFNFWIGIPAGALSLLCLDILVDGKWIRLIRPYLLRWLRPFPIFLLLLFPLFVSIPSLFEWYSKPVEMTVFQAWYLTPWFFIARSIFYVLLWSLLAFLLSSKRSPRIAAPALIVIGITMTLAATDWMMSLDKHWKSTVFGLIVIVGQALVAMSVCLFDISSASRHVRTRYAAPPRWPPETTMYDMGNILLALVMLWAYLFFSQYLVVWSGNLSDEAHWYVARSGSGGWATFGFIVLASQFFLPFGALLFHKLKGIPSLLSFVAATVFVAHWCENAWYVLPSLPPIAQQADLLWTEAIVTLSMGLIVFSLLPRLPLPDSTA